MTTPAVGIEIRNLRSYLPSFFTGCVTVGDNISVIISSDAIAFIEELPGSVLSISHLGGSGDIEIDDNGNVTNLGPDDSPFVTILDSDDDGVPDGDDVCPGMLICTEI